MLKKIFNIVKKIIMAALFLYAYNTIAAPLQTVVPINVITIVFVSILGLPGLFGLILISIIIF